MPSAVVNSLFSFLMYLPALSTFMQPGKQISFDIVYISFQICRNINWTCFNICPFNLSPSKQPPSFFPSFISPSPFSLIYSVLSAFHPLQNGVEFPLVSWTPLISSFPVFSAPHLILNARITHSFQFPFKSAFSKSVQFRPAQLDPVTCPSGWFVFVDVNMAITRGCWLNNLTGAEVVKVRGKANKNCKAINSSLLLT